MAGCVHALHTCLEAHACTRASPHTSCTPICTHPGKQCRRCKAGHVHASLSSHMLGGTHSRSHTPTHLLRTHMHPQAYPNFERIHDLQVTLALALGPCGLSGRILKRSIQGLGALFSASCPHKCSSLNCASSHNPLPQRRTPCLGSPHGCTAGHGWWRQWWQWRQRHSTRQQSQQEELHSSAAGRPDPTGDWCVRRVGIEGGLRGLPLGEVVLCVMWK